MNTQKQKAQNTKIADLVAKVEKYAEAIIHTHFPNGVNEPLSLILDLQFLLLQPACRSHSLNKNFCPLQGPQWQEILPKP